MCACILCKKKKCVNFEHLLYLSFLHLMHSTVVVCNSTLQVCHIIYFSSNVLSIKYTGISNWLNQMIKVQHITARCEIILRQMFTTMQKMSN